MSLPELLANSPTPGTEAPVGTLAAAITNTSATTITTTAAVVPVSLRASGQFRIRIDSELMLVTAGPSGTSWTVERGVEGSTRATHLAGASIFHDVTREGLVNLIVGIAGGSQIKPLGSVTGNVTPNLTEGRVFKGTTTGAVALQAVTGLPSSISSTLYWEVEFTGNHAITFPGITGWRYGGEPPQDISSPSSVNRFQFFTDDGISTYGVGSEGLPSTVVQAAVGAAGEVLTSDGAKYVAKPSAGLTKAQEEALEKAVIATAPLTITNAMSVNGVLEGTGTGTMHTTTYAASSTFSNAVQELAQTRLAIEATAVTTNKTLVVNTIYTVTTTGLTLKMPPSGLISGNLVVLKLAAGVAVTLEGKWTPSEPAKVTSEAFAGEETVTFVCDASTVWKALSGYRPQAALEATISSTVTGAWATLTIAALVKAATTSTYTPGARLEAGSVRLRGVLEIETAQTLGVNGKLFTLPAGKRPVGAEVYIATQTVAGATVVLLVAESGTVKVQSALTANTQVILDGKTFSIS